MRNKLAWWLTIGWGLIALFVSSVGAQTPQPPRTLPPSVQQAGFNTPPVATPEFDTSKLPPAAQEVYRGARSGAEWLCRVHQPNGRFLVGWVPDLNQPIQGDNFLSQARATFALARVARVFKDERYAARARQAVLTMLAETAPDPTDPLSRFTTVPSSAANRLGAAGLLLACIHELPDPAADLLDQGEQLARYIARRQQPNGSFRPDDVQEKDPDAAVEHAGEALYGLMRSNVRRPAAWKLDAARRALAYDRAWWGEHKSPAFVAGQTAGFAEVFVQSKERARDTACADFVFDMGDWLCGQQIRQLDVRHPQWQGGFAEFAQGHAATGPPKAASAAYAAAVIDACRVTRQKPDAERYGRYSESAFAALQFVMMLQYSEANTQHFAPGYRQRCLLGGVHVSAEDGSLRLEDTAHAVAALAAYWECVVMPELARKPAH
jgi:hypothetical protein